MTKKKLYEFKKGTHKNYKNNKQKNTKTPIKFEKIGVKKEINI